MRVIRILKNCLPW
uniref:Truncated envelope glycoprotein n=1 Tax=Human immunodeficiency virus type 1 TaxID=11676 RepID=A0A0H3YC01_HV1|nr:truncated envelope glycoprotein [Human immunodeficiency virus 1]